MENTPVVQRGPRIWRGTWLPPLHQWHWHYTLKKKRLQPKILRGIRPPLLPKRNFHISVFSRIILCHLIRNWYLLILLSQVEILLKECKVCKNVKRNVCYLRRLGAPDTDLHEENYPQFTLKEIQDIVCPWPNLTVFSGVVCVFGGEGGWRLWKTFINYYYLRIHRIARNIGHFEAAISCQR